MTIGKCFFGGRENGNVIRRADNFTFPVGPFFDFHHRSLEGCPFVRDGIEQTGPTLISDFQKIGKTGGKKQDR